MNRGDRRVQGTAAVVTAGLTVQIYRTQWRYLHSKMSNIWRIFLIKICTVSCAGSIWSCSALMRLHVLASFLCYSLFFQSRGSVLVWLALEDISTVFALLFFPRVDFSHGGVEELFSDYADRRVEPFLCYPLPRSWRGDIYFTVPYLPLFFIGQKGITNLIQLLFWAVIELIPSL